MVEMVYKNAFSEVYTILEYLDEEDFIKIPKSVIEIISENRNLDYEFDIDETIPLNEQNMLSETKAILFNIFRDYLSTSEQREKIKEFQRNDRKKY